ncbi:MAG: hypothetical protein ABSB35_24680, partial [Bryobacteraceae bacterium]
MRYASDYNSRRDAGERMIPGNSPVEFVPKSTTLTPLGIWCAVRRGKVLAASVLLTVLLLAAFYIWTLPKQYEAELRLF